MQNGFELLGSLPTLTAAAENCFYGYDDYLRGVFIGESVYAVARTGVKSAALEDPGSILGVRRLRSRLSRSVVKCSSRW